MRRQIEVYFILYLAAVLFLLPNKREKAPTQDENLALEALSSRFFIQPEKLTLNCQILTTGSTTNVVQLDSVNSVAFSGDYTDVHYEFYVEDVSLRQTVVAVSARRTMSGSFRMEEDSQRGVATFFWKPDLRDRRNRTLTVRVVATGRPVVPAAITEPALRERFQRLIADAGRIDTAQTTFTINVIATGAGNAFALNDSLQAVSATTSTTASTPSIVADVGGVRTVFRPPADYRPPPPGEFGLIAQNQTLEVLPFQQWNNAVLVSGLNLRAEMKTAPKVLAMKSDPNDAFGNAFVNDTRENALRVAGTAPSSGVMTVRVTVARAEDGKNVSTEFTVKASPLQRPQIPQRMYPGITYTFNPRMDFLTGQELRASIADANGKERYSSPQGSEFIFTPEESDAGKTLVFERFINGKRAGEIYNIPVEDFSAPEIVEIVHEDRVIKVRTRCFGTVGSKANRVSLDRSKTLNTRVSEQFGDFIRSEDRQESSQLFVISRIEPDKPISGTIRVIDYKNRASQIKSLER